MAAPATARGGLTIRSNAGPMTAGDRKRLKAQARGRDEELAAAFDAGRKGGPRPEDPELGRYFDDGAKQARTEGRRERLEQVGSSKPVQRAGGIANDGAGFLLGLVAYALLANFLRGGAAGARAWLSAKFVNRVSDAATPIAPARPATPTKPTTNPNRVPG